TVVHDFRARDLAARGQATPATALADFLMFRDGEETRLVLHLGGLTHAVLLPAGEDPGAVRGWEVGPGNALLDALFQQMGRGRERYDVGGRHAVQGRQIPELLSRWTNHPFLLRRAPTSAHRT